MPILLLTFLLLFPLAVGAAGVPPASSAPYWIANEGQWEGDFQFKCEVGSTVYYVTPTGMTVDFREFTKYVGADGNPPASSKFDPLERKRDPVTVRGHVVQIHYVKASRRQVSSPAPPTEIAIGENKLPHYSNYFLGRDSTKWRSRVGHYENVIVPEVWPGIDVEYRTDKQGVETIYHVKPGADPTQIQMEYLGLDAPLRVDAQGNLILTTSLGDVKEKAPIAFQQEVRTQKGVDVEFRVIDGTRVGYDVGVFDAGKELVVDPLIYGTYLGGSGSDGIHAMTIDSDGNLLLTGDTGSDNFPTTPGAYQEIRNESIVHITKLDPSGTEILFATFIGGERVSVWNIATNSRNEVWVAGEFETALQSEMWPLTENAIDTIADGGVEACFARISAAGDVLEYSSYLGGESIEQIYAIQTDENNNLYLTGITAGSFPITSTALFPDTSIIGVDGFLTVFDFSSESLFYSTYIPGDAGGVALSITSPGTLWLVGVTRSGILPVTPNAYQTELGNEEDGVTADAYFMAWDLNSNSLLYSSYLGAEGSESCSEVIYAEDAGILYLSGGTSSLNFPVSADAFDTLVEGNSPYDEYIAAIDTATNEIVATYIGGGGYESSYAGLYVDSASVTLVGSTFSNDFPTTAGAIDSIFNDNGLVNPSIPDYYVCRLNRGLTDLVYSTYLGGSQEEYSTSSILWGRDSIWVAGGTGSANFPITPNALQTSGSGWSDGGLLLLSLPPGSTDVGNEAPSIVTEFTLSAFPNPFNPTTTLSFSLPHLTNVTLKIHDILGREVERVQLGNMTAGVHEFKVDGDKWASGIYFATLEAPVFSRTQKLLLLR